jgi:serine/threonine protein kinase
MSARQATFRRGRYELHGEIASGGMATVYYGRLAGALGFTRTVAIKRIHPHLAKDPAFVSMFVDEVRLAARVEHPNVVRTLDVAIEDGEAFLVMEHILGEPLSRLIRECRANDEAVPVEVSAGIMAGILHGLHAAHDAKDERGAELHMVHRDVSPQNILLGADGTPRLIDFGVAKGAGRLQTTGEGQIKGKFGYMSPEQLVGDPLDRRSDIYAAGVVLWELLAGRSLVAGENNLAVLKAALAQRPSPPSTFTPSVSGALDQVVMRALARERDQRFATARQMAAALEATIRVAGTAQLAEWVKLIAGPNLAARARDVARIESGASASAAPGPVSDEEGPATRVTSVSEPRARAEPRGRATRARVAFAATLTAAALGTAGLAVTRGHVAEAPPASASDPLPPQVSSATPPNARASDPAPVAVAPVPSLPDPSHLGDTPRPPGPSNSEGLVPAPHVPRRAAPGTRSRPIARPAPSASIDPSAKPGPGERGCKVEQYADAEGFVRFRCAQ